MTRGEIPSSISASAAAKPLRNSTSVSPPSERRQQQAVRPEGAANLDQRAGQIVDELQRESRDDQISDASGMATLPRRPPPRDARASRRFSAAVGAGPALAATMVPILPLARGRDGASVGVPDRPHGRTAAPPLRGDRTNLPPPDPSERSMGQAPTRVPAVRAEGADRRRRDAPLRSSCLAALMPRCGSGLKIREPTRCRCLAAGAPLAFSNGERQSPRNRPRVADEACDGGLARSPSSSADVALPQLCPPAGSRSRAPGFAQPAGRSSPSSRRPIASGLAFHLRSTAGRECCRWKPSPIRRPRAARAPRCGTRTSRARWCMP